MPAGDQLPATRPPRLELERRWVLPVGYSPHESVSSAVPRWSKVSPLGVSLLSMETKGDRARLQVWLPVDLLDRIVVAAQEADRPVSREVVRRLEQSFRGLHMPDWQADPVEHPPRVPPEPVQRGASNDLTVHGYPPAVEKPARGPAEVKMPEPLAAAVKASGGAVSVGAPSSPPGDCRRAVYHRRGQYCKTCGTSY